MLLTDIVLIFALAVFVAVWWLRGLAGRPLILAGAATVALITGTLGMMDWRWQGGVGVVVAGLFLLILLINRLRGAEIRGGVPYVSGIVFALLAILAYLPIYWFPIFDLPVPAGEFDVGVRDFELIDDSRSGVMGAPQEEKRRLLIRVWYPAESIAELDSRPYFTDEETATTATSLSQNFVSMPFLFTHLKHTGTNSYENAPMQNAGGDLPVVFFSHGYASFAGQNTALMEHLASHGYVLFSVTHPYDAAAVLFPNGDVIQTDPEWVDYVKNMFGEMPEGQRKQMLGETLAIRREGVLQQLEESQSGNDRLSARSAPAWLEDRLFVLESLANGKAPDDISDILDRADFSAVGHMGMSFGGSTTGAVCMVDPRCAAAVNLDGGDLHFTPFNADIPTPFMMLHSDWVTAFEALGEGPGDPDFGFNDFSYERHETAGLRDDVYRLRVKDVTHLGVSDWGSSMRMPLRRPIFGSIEGQTTLNIMNDYVLGFFDKHLRDFETDFPDAQYAAHGDYVVRHDVSKVRDWWLSENPQDRTVGVVLETDLGAIEVRIYPERAPVSSANFLAYIDAGLYDGASFYRVTRKDNQTIPGQVMEVVQGGLMGNAMTKLSMAELGDIEPARPPIAHETTDAIGILNERGTIAFARLEPGTASSEFFFNLIDNPGLDTGNTARNPDGQGYATFGRVVRGLRVLEQIQSRPTDEPKALTEMQRQILDEPVVIRRAYRSASQ